MQINLGIIIKITDPGHNVHLPIRGPCNHLLPLQTYHDCKFHKKKIVGPVCIITHKVGCKVASDVYFSMLFTNK